MLAVINTEMGDIPEEITACSENTAMAGKSVSLDLDGEVRHQASLPERPEHGEQLESMRLRRL